MQLVGLYASMQKKDNKMLGPTTSTKPIKQRHNKANQRTRGNRPTLKEGEVPTNTRKKSNEIGNKEVQKPKPNTKLDTTTLNKFKTSDTKTQAIMNAQSMTYLHLHATNFNTTTTLKDPITLGLK